MRRIIPCVILALLFALIGPRILAPQSKTAGTPFVYEPPDGFILSSDKSLDPDNVGAKVWLPEEKKNFDGSIDLGDRIHPVRVVLTHSTKEMSVEEVDLANLAKEMPKVFEDTGCTWAHRRHELRTRGDGARVGLIEGDCDRDMHIGSMGLPPQKIRQRKLQLIFPDDSGTSIATISYPTDQATRWEPLFEATIGKARGVMTRAPVPPLWTHAACGFAGFILAWLGMSLVKVGGKPEPAPVPVAKKSEPTKKEDEVEEDEDDDEDDEAEDKKK